MPLYVAPGKMASVPFPTAWSYSVTLLRKSISSVCVYREYLADLTLTDSDLSKVDCYHNGVHSPPIFIQLKLKLSYTSSWRATLRCPSQFCLQTEGDEEFLRCTAQPCLRAMVSDTGGCQRFWKLNSQTSNLQSTTSSSALLPLQLHAGTDEHMRDNGGHGAQGTEKERMLEVVSMQSTVKSVVPLADELGGLICKCHMVNKLGGLICKCNTVNKLWLLHRCANIKS